MGRARRIALTLTVAPVIAAAGAVLWSIPGWLITALERFHPGCLYRVGTQALRVALTIDDAPDPVSTPLILRELRRNGARATFFLITERLQGQEPLVRQMITDGHELANHFTRDRPSILLGLPDFERDLLRADRQLAPFGRPVWARPGSGWYSRSMVEVMRRHGYRCALGSVYPFDATIPSAAFAAANIGRNVRPGSVIVLHDGRRRGARTAETLRRALPELRRRGYRVVSLSELAGTTEGRAPR